MTKTVTVEQVTAACDRDPVLAFARKVNERATADPLWATDFRAALYYAFIAESQQRLAELLSPTHDAD